MGQNTIKSHKSYKNNGKESSNSMINRYKVSEHTGFVQI